jgi:hypothetical protein
MPEAEDIAAQEELLTAHRRTLHHFLKQRALAGEMLIPPNVTHGEVPTCSTAVKYCKGG